MLAISNFISSTASSDLAFSGGGRTRALTVMRRANAKRMRLTIDPRDASVRLTIPRRAALRPALAWAAERRVWIEAELARLPPPCPIVPGMAFSIGGSAVRLDWGEHLPRRPVLIDDALRIGGPRDQLAPHLLRYLRAQSAELLDSETRALAAAHGIAIGRIGVGDPKSRWGSCSDSGDIRYSWRLILAPGFILRAVVAHEIAHRRHMNHSPAFHALAAQIGGIDPAVSRAWLRANGAALHWFGRDG